MRSLIYNQWVATLGGGEQTLGAFALTLAAYGPVDVITHEQPDWDRFREILGFDLAEVGCRVVPEDPMHYRGVSEATRDYDLFVNCSYLDHVRAYARCNVMQVFFPPAPPADAGAVRPLPRRLDAPGPTIEAVGGLYRLESDYHGPFAWTDGCGRFALSGADAGPVELTVSVASIRPAGEEPADVVIMADGVPLGPPVTLPERGYVTLSPTLPAGQLQPGRPVFVDVTSSTFAPSRHRTDPRALLGVRVASIAATQGAGRPAQVAGPAGLERWTDHCRFYDAVDSYDLLLANSHFTQRWIAQRLGRASELLYPPVQVGQFRSGAKRHQIISVGRFFVEGHSKKQLHMIELFKRLCDEGLDGWEYHLVGGTRHDPGAARYLERCRAAAVGYPIVFHPDAPLSTLARLYGESVLYWNATGYGEDPDVEPDRFEHFGMTTVEAMAGGCVPLSYARAGQPEVIEQWHSGVLFETLDELGDATMRLIDDPHRLALMSEAAILRSGTFSYDNFRTSLLRILADVDGLAAANVLTDGDVPSDRDVLADNGVVPAAGPAS